MEKRTRQRYTQGRVEPVNHQWISHFCSTCRMVLFQTHCVSSQKQLYSTNIKCHNSSVSRTAVSTVDLTRKCAFHLNNVIKVDLHLKREGVEQLQSLWAFSDCNMRFGSEVKWMWTGVCASHIESFNYFSVAIWFSACVFMTISLFWQAKAKNQTVWWKKVNSTN